MLLGASVRPAAYALLVAVLGVGAGDLGAFFVDGFDDVVVSGGAATDLALGAERVGGAGEGVGVGCVGLLGLRLRA